MNKKYLVLSESFWRVFGVSILLLTFTASAVFADPIPTTQRDSDYFLPEAPAFVTPVCVDFEDLLVGATYSIGDIFVESGAVITAQSFTWGNGTVYTNGLATIGNIGLAGGAGLETNLNNITLEFDFGEPLTGLSFQFGEYGGNLNIEVNGDFRNFQNFVNINGLTIGGTTVQVVNGLGNDTGLVRLSGSIQSFAIGGQELWIDEVCPEGNCVDFEDLVLSNMYYVSDPFIDAGVLLEGDVFIWGDGSVFPGGVATVLSQGQAGGAGLELNLNNINLIFDFGEDLKGLSLDFGEYGGNLNININGDFRNFDNFVDLHTQIVGGVQVVVFNGLGNDMGRLYLFGEIDYFSLGGQELWLDNICPETCCVDFESLPPLASYNVGDSLTDSGAAMDLEDFVWTNGTAYSAGVAQVGTLGLAGGSYKEMNLNNINLQFDFGKDLKRLTLLFGEYGGNLNIEINGDFRNFLNFNVLDGLTVGGVSVSVVNGFGNDKGRLALEGLIHSFSVGGQELWIDDVCPVEAERIFLPAMVKNFP